MNPAAQVFGCLGDNTIDVFSGAETAAYVGGNAVNVAVQLSRLGRPVRYAGAVGADPWGSAIRRVLTAQGVDVSLLHTRRGPTAHTDLRVLPSGDRVIEREEYGVSGTYRPWATDLDALAACAVVHLGMVPEAAAVRRALKARGAVVSQDCAVSPGFDGLDVAFCSAGEDLDHADELARSALAGGARLAVVTCGASGAMASDGARSWRCLARPAVVVDTTGAGDSFIAGFLDAYVAAGDIQGCLEAGARTAAATVEHPAGFPQPPLAERTDGRD